MSFSPEINDMCDLAESIKFNDPQPLAATKNRTRKITPTDVFPCYTCGNDTLMVRDCSTCDGKGFLDGTDPMVLLIQKIIDTKIQKQQLAPQQQPAATENNPLSNSLTFNFGADRGSKSIKFRIDQDKDETHSIVLGDSGVSQGQYICDGCRKDILSKRYNCLSCDDYDLCEKCYPGTTHEHTFREVLMTSQVPTVGKKSVTLDKATQKSVLLQKSIRSSIGNRNSQAGVNS